MQDAVYMPLLYEKLQSPNSALVDRGYPVYSEVAFRATLARFSKHSSPGLIQILQNGEFQGREDFLNLRP